MPRNASLAKLSRPRLFDVVARERLFSFLDENRGRPLIWIGSPPGSGKTALTASYLEARGLPFIWYQVDSGDADPGSFFLHLSQAASDLLDQDPLNVPRFAPEHHVDLQGFSRLYFRALLAQLPSGTLLVLDNYQEAAGAPALHAIVCQAVSEIPSGSSLLVLSRNEPPPHFVQLSATGAQVSLGWNELRMTLEEVRVLCAQRHIKDEWLLQALHHQSQGWAAGLTLMIERLGNFDGSAQTLPSDTLESVFNYFASLIFDQAGPVNRHVLLSVAFLRNVTPEVARSLSDFPEAPSVLEDLYRRRMFIDRRPGVEPVYQFHALFREFLSARASLWYSKEQLQDLMARSAVTLESSGELDQAMELWCAIENWDRVVALIKKEAAHLLNSGRRQTLHNWIETISQDRRNAEPWLLYWLGIVQVQTSPETAHGTLQRALELFRQKGYAYGRMMCLAGMLHYAMVGFVAIDEMKHWLDELLVLTETCSEYPSADDELRIIGVLCQSLFYIKPWHPMTRNALHRTVDLLPSCSDLVIKLAAATGAVAASAQCGEFDRAEQIVRMIEHDAILEDAGPASAAWWLTQVGYLNFNKADYDSALRYFAQGGEVIRRHGLHEKMREVLMFRVMVEFRVYGWTVAGQTLAEVEAMPPSGRPMTSTLLNICCARKQQFLGNAERAAELAALSQQGAIRTNSVYQETVFELINAEVLIAAGRTREAVVMLNRSRDFVERSEIFDFFAAAPTFVEALLALVGGQRDAATSLLRESLALALAGNRRYFLRYFETCMPPLFKLALEEHIEVDLVRDLIKLFRLKPPKEAPDSWPWPVRIRTFGRFEILVGGEVVQFSRKQPRKPLMLLKALISFGGSDVPDQMLCDALWGDEDGDAAANALDITVVRMRKLLGGNETVLRHGSRISLNTELCWIDATVFESRVNNLEDRHSLDLYRGTFLPEDAGEPWSVAKRERLRGKFIHALSNLGASLERDGKLDEAMTHYVRGIDADTVVETFHQGLMRCLNRMGRRSEAISTYRQLKQTLSVVLGVPPSEASQNLYRDLLQDQIQDGGEFKVDARPVETASFTTIPFRRSANSRRDKI